MLTSYVKVLELCLTNNSNYYLSLYTQRDVLYQIYKNFANVRGAVYGNRLPSGTRVKKFGTHGFKYPKVPFYLHVKKLRYLD